MTGGREKMRDKGGGEAEGGEVIWKKVGERKEETR